MSLQSQYVIGLYCDVNPTKSRCRHNIVCPLGYSWQLSSNEKSLVGKKNSSICLKKFTDLDFFYTENFFFIFFDKCLFTLLVTQSVCCILSSQPF